MTFPEYRRSRVPVLSGTTLPTAATPCREAPSAIVGIIDASFTNGEHLKHTQAMDGTHAETYVGGNIFGPDDMKESSQNTWVLSNGQVYALTSDARRRTLLPDGRDLDTHYFEWTDFNDAVSKCVGDIERAENQGR